MQSSTLWTCWSRDRHQFGDCHMSSHFGQMDTTPNLKAALQAVDKRWTCHQCTTLWLLWMWWQKTVGVLRMGFWFSVPGCFVRNDRRRSKVRSLEGRRSMESGQKDTHEQSVTKAICVRPAPGYMNLDVWSIYMSMLLDKELQYRLWNEHNTWSSLSVGKLQPGQCFRCSFQGE